MKRFLALILVLSAHQAMAQDNRSDIAKPNTTGGAGLDAILDALIFGPQGNRSCIAPANTAAGVIFDAYLDSIPNAQSPEGLLPIEKPTAQDSNKSTYVTKGEYFVNLNYGYSYDTEATVNLVLDSKCALVSKSVTERTLNIDPPQDEEVGKIPCMEELGLVCKPGWVDQCRGTPKAPTHHCVPDVK